MIVGVDFDNTIVCYDGLFHAAAVEQTLAPTELPVSKGSVRDYLRQQGREDDWTRLQGYIYGFGMHRARVFPGVREFFHACARENIPLYIISHRTERPFLGPDCDLHAAAIEWLHSNSFFDKSGMGLPPECVFFETRAERKIERIFEMGCTHFIDDLPEFLGRPDFPGGVHRILFQPHANGATVLGLRRAANWDEIRGIILQAAGVRG
jgi:hypothetical protein